MKLFGDMTEGERAIFASIPRVHEDAGEELTRLAKELQDKSPKLNFERALERTLEARPDLGDEHLNFDRYEAK